MVERISSDTAPDGILPGQRAMKGTREPPSHDDIFQPRSGSAFPEWSRGINSFPSGIIPFVVSTHGPLSEVKTTSVLSSIFSSFSVFRISP